MASHLMIDTSPDVVEAWVTVMDVSQRLGRALGDGDAWVAACALANGARLLTHDADFRGLHVRGLDIVCHAP